MVLMNFLSRVTFNDRMTPLDYDLFYKIRKITGVTVDRFSYVLMVDADTVLGEKSLKLMVRAMHNDETIMGLCGETRIANKTASWVTTIQVGF
jgi:chitin synthase